MRRIGGGGMAELYLARLDGPNRFVKPVALKLMHAHLLDTPEFVAMFMREARIAASLQHPQIVQVLDVGEEDGEYFLALEYVHGLDLRRVLIDRRGVPLPLGAALRIVIDIATGLHHAHSLCDGSGRPLGIVHRDVSPSNILVAYDGAVKLTDFGIARMTAQTHVTATGSIKGKPGYMSPEQCLQDDIDARSDVFSLGVVLYELTTGRPAFPGEMIAAMNRVIDGRFTPPGQVVGGYPSALAMIVTRALAARAEHRYSSAAAFRAALENFARAHRELDTSTDALVGLLASRFGSPALPDLDTPPPMPVVVMPPMVDAATTMLTAANGSMVPVKPRARSHRVTVGAIGVLAGALLGWQVARASAAYATEAGAVVPAGIAAAAPLVAAAPNAATPPHGAAAPNAAPAESTDDEVVIVPDSPISQPVVNALPRVPVVASPLVSRTAEPTIDFGNAAPATRTRDDARREKRTHRRAKPSTPESPARPATQITAPPSRSADAMLPRSAR